jgi:hypothetical protein
MLVRPAPTISKRNITMTAIHKLVLVVAAVLALGSSSFAVDPIIGPQVRIDVTGGPERANETTASASELHPDRIVTGWNDYRDSPDIRSGFGVSFDGGQTWTDFLLRPPAGFQASVEGDPMVAHDDRTGTLWAGAISFTSGGGIYVARMNPGDTSFMPSVMAEHGSVDKGWMAAGPGPPMSGGTRLYCAYNLGIIWSKDMGDTWTNPVSLGSGLGYLPRVGPNGEVYVAYWDLGSGVMLKRSLDGGQTFTTHTIAVRMDVWGVQEGSRFPGTFRVPSMTYIDVDPNSGVLYAVYFDTTNWPGGQANVDMYFTKSIRWTRWAAFTSCTWTRATWLRTTTSPTASLMPTTPTATTGVSPGTSTASRPSPGAAPAMVSSVTIRVWPFPKTRSTPSTSRWTTGTSGSTRT